MGDVVEFDGVTTLPIHPDKVLSGAVGKLQSVILAGYAADGSIYVAGTHSEVGENLLLLERAKNFLMAEFDDFNPAA